MTPKEATHTLIDAVLNRTRCFSTSKNSIAWRLERNSWYSIRWLSVTEYAPGCLRFRNDTAIRIPKRVWPLEVIDYGDVGRIEITIHESEVKELAPLLVEIAEDASKSYSSPLFPNKIISPNYCWSIKANATYNQMRSLQSARKLKV